MTSEVAATSNGVNLTSESNTQHEVEITEEISGYPNFYRAAAWGEIEMFMEVQPDVLPRILTPNNNTILHISIASQTHKMSHKTAWKKHARRRKVSNKFVEQILQKCPTLLLKANHRGETPLHTAARYQNAAVVEVLIKCAETQLEDPESRLGAVRSMLGMVDRMNNTALHVAAMSGSTLVVKLLTEKDSDFPYLANDSGQTPLYIASLSEDLTMVAEMLQNCKVLAHEGPNGQTALHAAAMRRNPDIIKAILEKIPKLSRKVDENGWTPLHHAAYNGIFVTTKALLEIDPYAVYIKDKRREMTPLLLASGQGHVQVVALIIKNCPDCCEIADSMGWNVLHFVMVSIPQVMVVPLILSYPLLANLINDTNVNGNTPLNLLALVCHPAAKTAKLMKTWEPEVYSVLDKRNMSAFDVTNYGSPELKDKIHKLSIRDDSGPYRKGVIRNYEFDEKLIQIHVEKTKATHLVVAALIATVTFTAAFTIPGGYKEEESKNPGSAILSRNSAFQAFVTTNAIAMILSMMAVFIHFVLPGASAHRYLELLYYEHNLTMVSMGAMVIAFVTGSYAVVSSSLGLAVVICHIGLSFFIGVICVFRRAYKSNVEALGKIYLPPNNWEIARSDLDKLRKELDNLTSA